MAMQYNIQYTNTNTITLTIYYWVIIKIQNK